MLEPLRQLVRMFQCWLTDASCKPGFWSGALIGAAGLASVTFIVFRVRIWWGNVTAPYRPQAVTHTTGATPAQVTKNSLKAFVLGVVTFACILCTAIEMMYPGILRDLLRRLGLMI
jgi:hypothetical protein